MRKFQDLSFFNSQTTEFEKMVLCSVVHHDPCNNSEQLEGLSILNQNSSSSSYYEDGIFGPEQIISCLLLLASFITGITWRKSVVISSRWTRAYVGTLIYYMRQLWYCLVLHYYGLYWTIIEFCQKHRRFDINSIPKRSGHVAVITGGARGIGIHVVKKLLECEMHVIIGCRNTASGNRVIEQIRRNGLNLGKVEVLELDLMSLDSVRIFANKILSKNIPIHILINNAGIMFVPYKLTPDGLESQFQVNYLSHFLLSNLLLPRMKETASSTDLNDLKGRIINVSSLAHYGGGNLNFDDLSMKSFYSPYLGYMNAKFLQVLSSNLMNEQLSAERAGVFVNSVHPGIVRTELYEHLWWVNAFQFFVKFIFKSPEQGADTILYAALSQDLAHDGGHYIANCMKYKPKSKTTKSELQQLVYETSSKLTGILTRHIRNRSYNNNNNYCKRT